MVDTFAPLTVAKGALAVRGSGLRALLAGGGPRVSAGSTAAFRSFMSGLVDYAGLFPPAALDMAPAVAEYAAPPGRSRGLDAGPVHRPGRPAGASWQPPAPTQLDRRADLGLFGAGRRRVTAPDAALAAVRGPGRAPWPLSRTRSRPGAGRGPGSAPAGGRSRARGRRISCRGMLDGLADGGSGRARTLPGGSAGRWTTTGVLEAINALAACREPRFPAVGAKLRCGGVDARGLSRRCERIAAVHRSPAARLGLPLKCTAGLHHPVRHRATEPDVMMHGFLNVFGAGVLAYGDLDADRDGLTACVAETDPAAFAFRRGRLRLARPRCSTPTIWPPPARDSWRGFGSCSFAEPRDDLRTLGLCSWPEPSHLKGWIAPWIPPSTPPSSSFVAGALRTATSPCRICPTASSRRRRRTSPAVGVRIGDMVLDLAVIQNAGCWTAPACPRASSAIRC